MRIGLGFRPIFWNYSSQLCSQLCSICTKERQCTTEPTSHAHTVSSRAPHTCGIDHLRLSRWMARSLKISSDNGKGTHPVVSSCAVTPLVCATPNFCLNCELFLVQHSMASSIALSCVFQYFRSLNFERFSFIFRIELWRLLKKENIEPKCFKTMVDATWLCCKTT